MQTESCQITHNVLQILKSNRQVYLGPPIGCPVRGEGTEGLNEAMYIIWQRQLEILDLLLNTAPNSFPQLLLESLIHTPLPPDTTKPHFRARIWANANLTSHQGILTTPLDPKLLKNYANDQGLQLLFTQEGILQLGNLHRQEETLPQNQEPDLSILFLGIADKIIAVGAPKLLLLGEAWRDESNQYARTTAIFNPTGLTLGLNNPWRVVLQRIFEIRTHQVYTNEELLVMLPNNRALAALQQVRYLITNWSVKGRETPPEALIAQIHKLVKDIQLTNHPYIKKKLPLFIREVETAATGLKIALLDALLSQAEKIYRL